MPAKKIEEEVVETKPSMILESSVVVPEPVVTVSDLGTPQPQPMPIQVEGSISKSGGWGWGGVLIALVLGVTLGIGVGYMIWGNRKVDVVTNEPVKKEANVIMPTVEPTKMPEVVRSELKVRVLNGSGVSGAAAKAKSLLESLGYGEVVTGNADADTYGKSEITAVRDEVWATVKVDFASKYEVSDVAGNSDLGEYDVVIILGAN